MKWKKIGSIIVLNQDVEDIQKFLKMPGIDTVIKLGYINGQKRQPDVKILAGSNTETIHKENRCLFKLDVSKVMWSKGNVNERMRITQLVQQGEHIVDMFAGIGYFSIPLAVHSPAEKIYSIEINPVAFHYLNENIILNKVENRVKPILGDSKEIAPTIKADRVIMGYVGTTHHFLGSALKCIVDGGIIHYHETVPDKIMHERPINRIKKAADNRKVTFLQQRIIKKYSPGVSHIVVDARIE
ncbi:class I SAM-dependent methyltransferase [Methanobacterium alcaliphilum]|uniref:class I SAM-dependent methyltransferase n=1 Tax=Methanobacterium alcaliphilum TaxID=392018 RepID=UPI00200B4EE1|nr:class I SAM-dependent methyltransferase family protein [Methanobacterium alcaliphilum]MCK9151498.1 class I SAM-dependent methyltransferase family protein [Methanobacterium alcaliphilum]